LERPSHIEVALGQSPSGLERVRRALRLLTRCHEALVRGSDEATLFADLCALMVGVGGYALCWVGLAEHDARKTVRPIAHAGDDDGYLATIDVVWSDTVRGRGPTGTAMRTGRPVIGHDFATDESLLPWREEALRRGFRSSSALPLVHDGEQIGVITMYSVRCEVFDEAELEILGQLSSHLAYGIHARRQQEARRKVETTLARQNALLQALINSPVDTVLFALDLEGRYTAFNDEHRQAMQELWGVAIEPGLPFLDCVLDPRLRDGARRAIRRALGGEAFTELHTRLEIGACYEFTWSPIKGPEGGVTGVTALGRDVSKSRRDEQALRESEERFATAFQRSPVSMTIVSVATERYVEVNDAFLRVSGFARDEIVGYTSAEIGAFVDPMDRARLIEEVTRTGATDGLEMRLRTHAGDIREANVSTRLIRIGGQPHFLSTILDVTDRKRAEAERERLATAIEQAAEVVLITDRAGTITYVNPAFEVVTGYSRSEAIGKSPAFLKSGAHDAAFYRGVWDAIAHGATWRGHLVNRRKNGQIYTEDATISPVRAPSGEIVSYVAVKRDISAELAVEEQLRQAQKMDGIGRLAGGVAHDFNNILNVILACASFAKEALPEGPVLDDVVEVEKAGLRAAALTRQLLAFSRKQVLQPVRLDLNQVLSELEKMLRRIIREDIALSLELAPALWPVRADPGQIEQVIMNLVVNARDAMPQGGSVHLETRNVEFDAEQALAQPGLVAGPHVRLSVRDSGVGMDEATLTRIFEPFFTTKPVGAGTGLGLSTAYGIVRQSGGAISVETELGQGTTFHVFLPRDSSVRKESERTLAAIAVDPKGETILLVEDDAAVRIVTKRILEGAGYVVQTAASGEEALACCRETGHLHLILTDVVMPSMSGPEFVEQASQLRSVPRVLFMSGYADRTLGVHEEGDRQFISKPFTRSALLHKVRTLLDG